MTAVVLFSFLRLALSLNQLSPSTRNAVVIWQSTEHVQCKKKKVFIVICLLLFLVVLVLVSRSLWQPIRDEEWSGQSRTSCITYE